MKMENFLFKMGIQPIAMLVYHRVLFFIGVMDQKTFGLPAFHYVSSYGIHFDSICFKKIQFWFSMFYYVSKDSLCFTYVSLCFHFDSLSLSFWTSFQGSWIMGLSGWLEITLGGRDFQSTISRVGYRLAESCFGMSFWGIQTWCQMLRR